MEEIKNIVKTGIKKTHNKWEEVEKKITEIKNLFPKHIQIESSNLFTIIDNDLEMMKIIDNIEIHDTFCIGNVISYIDDYKTILNLKIKKEIFDEDSYYVLFNFDKNNATYLKKLEEWDIDLDEVIVFNGVEDISKFNNFIEEFINYNENDISNPIKNYISNIIENGFIIEDSGITYKHSNFGVDQSIFFKAASGNKYKIIIHLESYVFQSYAKVYSVDLKNGLNIIESWELLKWGYKSTTRKDLDKNYFNPIIQDCIKFIKKLEN